jgi:hypothetical protein
LTILKTIKTERYCQTPEYNSIAKLEAKLFSPNKSLIKVGILTASGEAGRIEVIKFKV